MIFDKTIINIVDLSIPLQVFSKHIVETLKGEKNDCLHCACEPTGTSSDMAHNCKFEPINYYEKINKT